MRTTTKLARRLAFLTGHYLVPRKTCENWMDRATEHQRKAGELDLCAPYTAGKHEGISKTLMNVSGDIISYNYPDKWKP